MNLRQLGWNQQRDDQLAALDEEYPGAFPARVARVDQSQVTVWSERGAHRARLSPALRRSTSPPAVGDWAIVVSRGGDSRVERLLPRSTVVARRGAGRAVGRQVVAANLDTVFVVCGLDGDFSLRRLERYLVAVGDGGASPVVLLTKAGSCDAVRQCVEDAQEIAGSAPVHAIDVVAGINADVARAYLQPPVTVALVGSSGVGKSTLVNAWLGEQRQTTKTVRATDRRGRHTTSAGELFTLPSGAVVVDTPGMRQLGLWVDEDAVDDAFSDIGALAGRCRFRDCGHRTEPGCAVLDAVERGALSRDRVESHFALQREAAYTSALMPEHERRRRGRAGAKMIRDVKRWKKGWR